MLNAMLTEGLGSKNNHWRMEARQTSDLFLMQIHKSDGGQLLAC